MNLSLLSSVSIFCSLLCATSVSAAELQSAEKLKITEPVLSDLYLAGGEILIQSEIQGDLLLIGGDARLQNDVSEDLHVAAGRIQQSGDIADDARLIAGEIEMDGLIGGDLLSLAGTFELSNNSIVYGDVYIAGGEVVLDGSVAGDVTIYAGRVIINGDVAGNLYIEAEDIDMNSTIGGTSTIVAKDISLGASAAFENNVTYYEKSGNVSFESKMINGTALFDASLKPYEIKKEHKDKSMIILFIVGIITAVLSAVFIIALLTLLDKTIFTDVAKELTKQTWPSVLYGFLYFAVTPIAAFVLMLTIIGIPVSLVLLTVYGFSIVFAKPITAFALTKVLQLRYKKKWNKWKIFFIAIGVFVVLEVIGSIPLLGWFVMLLVTCGAYGSIMTVKYRRFQKIR